MSEVKLVIRDASRDLSLTCHASDAHRVIAALSADPATIEELQVAMQRFLKLNGQKLWGWAVNGIDDEPWDSGLVVVDLAARLVLVDCSYFCASSRGRVLYQNGDHVSNLSVNYVLSDAWYMVDDSVFWRATADKRRAEFAQHTPLDTRSVLYGNPLLEFIAHECWQAFLQLGPDDLDSEEIPALLRNDSVVSTGIESPVDTIAEPEENPVCRIIREIHARWLMTMRADLREKTPREILVAERERLEDDLQHRQEQWSQTQECPRGLDRTSHAFRFGGFATHEIVKYYYLVRELLWSCWERLSDLAADNECRMRLATQGPAIFVAEEIERLKGIREEWLDAPDPECHMRTPRAIIERERARIPETVSGREAMVDPDCPCCQMLADLPGPTFLHLDGCNMDCDFAFDFYHRERKDWEAEQASYEDYFRSKSVGSDQSASGSTGDLLSGVWSRSFSMAESTDLPIGVRLLGIAWHVAELVMELNEISQSQPLSDQLNRDLRNLREVLCGSDDARLDSLVDPVLERFAQTLDTIADERPDLEPRCTDLERKLESFRDRPISSDC